MVEIGIATIMSCTTEHQLRLCIVYHRTQTDDGGHDHDLLTRWTLGGA